MQNIEFKAELRDLDAARTQCQILNAQHIGFLRQTDTYFKLPDGRLKIREAPGEPIEWIYYHRSDQVSPKVSNYTILSDDQARRRWGTHSLREWLIVRKIRDLWMLENTRIHLDEVDRLGDFLELEAVVSREHDQAECRLIVEEIRSVFAPILGEQVAVSYSDLMEQWLEQQEQA